MLYLVVTLILVLLSIVLFLPRFQPMTDRYSLGFNFFLTLIATLVGVLLAISITNFDSERREKEDMIKLLHASISSIETCHDYSEELLEFSGSLKKGSAEFHQFFDKNPLPYPSYLDTVLAQNIISKNMSQQTLADFNEILINLKRGKDVNGALYIQLLNEVKSILSAEISYQQGDLSLQQLQVKLGDIKRRSLSQVNLLGTPQ